MRGTRRKGDLETVGGFSVREETIRGNVCAGNKLQK